MLNFVKISQTLAEISRFPIFQLAAGCHLGFSSFVNLNGRQAVEVPDALLCQISSKPIKGLWRSQFFHFSKWLPACLRSSWIFSRRLLIRIQSNPLFPITQGTLLWQPILWSKSAYSLYHLGITQLIGISQFHFNFKRFNGDDLW